MTDSEPVLRYEPDPEAAEGMGRWRKKPVVVHAERQTVPFEVQTLEGLMRGQPGDWLVVNGVTHAWRNDNDEPAVMVGLIIGAEHRGVPLRTQR